MNQSIEEQRDSEEQNKTKRRSDRRKRSIAAVGIALLVLFAVPILAWLYMQRSMETITKVNMPYALRIGAGDTQPIQQLELSNIDVSGETKYKEVVFCVYSAQAEKKYQLQLAYTTNIGFSYQIYKASIDPQGDIDYLGIKYKKGESLDGKYLNKDSTGYATEAYHTTTYGNYDSSHVQKSAEPLYWKTNAVETLPTKSKSNDFYVNYYILRISWDDNVQNNKETDMIYLMAG